MYRKFFTAINCMDGRVQLPVIEYLKARFNIIHVDMITEPAPNLTLSDNTNTQLLNSIFARVNISVNIHNSEGIVVTGHYDCAGNPADKTKQIGQIKKSIAVLKKKYPQLPVYGLWLNEKFEVNEVTR